MHHQSAATTRWAVCNLLSDWIYVLKKIPHSDVSISAVFWSSCHFMCKKACVKVPHSLGITVASLINGLDRKQGHFKPYSQRTAVRHGPHQRIILHPLFSPK